MSANKTDYGDLIINADAERTDRACDITFDTENEAEEAMCLLAEALCGRWQAGDSEKLLS